MLRWTTSFLAQTTDTYKYEYSRNPLAHRLARHAFNNDQSLREHIDLIDIN